MKILQLDKEAIDGGFTLPVPLGSRITVGRKPQTQFVADVGKFQTITMHVLLPFPEVSGRHAEIEYASDACKVTDRSTNGTKVNGESISNAQPVGDGDVLSFAGYDVKLRFVDPFEDSGAYAVSPPAIEIDEPLLGHVKEALVADTDMWLNAQKDEYTCFTCLEEVAPTSKACSKCMPSTGGFELKPGKMIYHGLKLLGSGLRWDRLFFEATNDSKSSFLVEMRPLHERDLPLVCLLNADCQMLEMRHPNIINLFAWFEYPYPGWKYGHYYVRVIENIKAVNAQALLFRFGPFPWRSAVSIILEALKPLIYSLEQGHTVLVDSFQPGQLWIVDLGDAKYGVKVDCHRRSLIGWVRPKALAESENFWTQLHFQTAAAEASGEMPASYRAIILAASALYEMITGKCPPGRGLFDEPPDMVLFEEPQLAALVLHCLGEPLQAPKTLEELRDKLTQIQEHS